MNTAPLRALVVAPQWIGDAVMSEPLLRRLADRGERLSVGALPWVAPVYRAMPQVAEVLEWPLAHGRLDWTLRRRIAAGLRGRFERAYVLPNSLKSALIPWLARVPLRSGYRGEGRYLLLNRRAANPPGRPPMASFYAALAGAGDVPAPRLVVAAERCVHAARSAGVAPGAYWVFAPGAEYGPAKCWPAAHYSTLARSVHASSGCPVLLLGSGKEAALCESIARDAAPACRVLAGQTSLDDAMALIAAARGLVSNDSGLMHVGAAFGIPQVAVFGSTSPLHTPPLNERARVLWLKDELGLACAPCFDRTCRFGHTRCLVELPPQRVHAALEQAVAAPGR
jgi:heptosyltransferase II